ncbi:hypothetical protein [Adhaeribacter pallidiroseus]|nr:hypothetical protein [Adhaeribacter pallidiroseus]
MDFVSECLRSMYVRDEFIKAVYFFIFLGVFSCNNRIEETEKSGDKNIAPNSTTSQKKDNSKFYTTNDTLTIVTESSDTLEFAQKEFNRIVDMHPELYGEIIYNPDCLYHQFGNNVEFDSEQGQDAYFVLYAYFLKQKNGVDKFTKQRKILIEIYSHLNSLFKHFQFGGTFFGHQQLRILGYAEYSIYLLLQNEDDFEKTYNIAKQKELYIKSLRQLIADESSTDYETLKSEKVEREKKLNRIVDEINTLITDVFYLRRAQAFQYGYYEYY